MSGDSNKQLALECSRIQEGMHKKKPPNLSIPQSVGEAKAPTLRILDFWEGDSSSGLRRFLTGCFPGRDVLPAQRFHGGILSGKTFRGLFLLGTSE